MTTTILARTLSYLRHSLTVLLILMALGMGFLLRGQLAPSEPMPKQNHETTMVQPPQESTVSLWTCAMHPQKNFNQGDYVRVGDRIYAIADLSQVWVLLDAYESDLPWIRYGQELTFTTQSYPGRPFLGRIAFIAPVLDDQTRTVKVRVNVPNPDGLLKPDMFVSGVVSARIAAEGKVVDLQPAGMWISPMHPEIVKDGPGKCPICGMPLVRAEELGYAPADRPAKTKPLVIPTSAALVTGTRAIVYVELPGKQQPTYEGREVVLGPRAGQYYLVRGGLEEGELVVVHGNFKLDSALQIQAKPSMMTPYGGGGGGHHHGGAPAVGSGSTRPEMSTPLPAEFHLQLARVEQAAGGVTGAVQSGDVAKVRTAFAALGQALRGVEPERLQNHPRMLWDEFAMLLNNDVTEGREVKQITEARRLADLLQEHLKRAREKFKTLRELFAPLSGVQTALVRAFGVDTPGPIYRLQCSMAFGGRGATWLQKDDQPRNPYFGSAMPSCADNVERIGRTEVPPQPRGEHRHD